MSRISGFAPTMTAALDVVNAETKTVKETRVLAEAAARAPLKLPDGEESDLLDMLQRIPATKIDTPHALFASASAQEKKLQTLGHALDALCGQVSSVKTEPITHANAKVLYGERAKIMATVSRVLTALKDAGECSAAKHFPIAQLNALARVITDENQAIAQVGYTLPVKPMLAKATAQDAPKVLAQLLNAPHLEAPLAALGAKDAEALVAFARLADEALAAPNYKDLGKGWFYPRARRDYRARAQDTFTHVASDERRLQSRDTLRSTLEAVASGKTSVQDALCSAFLSEIGAEPNKTWKTNATAIARLLDKECLLPLRALNETKHTLNRGSAKLSGPTAAAVDAITKHMVQGDYREWRYDNPVGKGQLSGLDKPALASWKATTTTQGDLATREEDDIELLWVTKIGGPSHGFDYGGECLLPLLSNARTKAILVEDPRWPHNAAARAYLRLLHTEDGSPVLYLEPLQRDFPHREAFGSSPAMDDAFYSTIVAHAVKKSEEMGIPLSLNDYAGDLLLESGWEGERVSDRLILRASNGVYEASDTLGLGHDWPQMEDQLTPPLPRLLFTPKKDAV